jgi:hypothetical protein
LDRDEMGRSDVQGGGGWWVVVVDVASDGDWKGGGKCWLVCGEVKSRQGKAKARLGWMFNVAPRWTCKSTNGREWWSWV